MEPLINDRLKRLEEVEASLGQPDIVQDQKKYQALAREHSYLSQVKWAWDELSQVQKQLTDNEELIQAEEDPEFIAVLEEDTLQLQTRKKSLTSQLQVLLVPPDPDDDRNTILELRAGTGGDEAALFVGDCVRMYQMFAAENKWTCETLSSTPSSLGGFRDYVMGLSGPKVYRYLRNEGGTHRVQRIPETETQGRVHTSAITVAVMREPDQESPVEIEEKDLRIDTYRASGAGGQHVNVTDSAVRLTHLPTGIVVTCQDERSQHKNRDKAMRLLKAKIAEAQKAEEEKRRATSRAKQVGTGDRSERIRTYNFPQNRITDHRIQFTEYNLDRVMEGELNRVIEALVAETYKAS